MRRNDMDVLKADPRRRVILQAAGKLFAERGVERTTTRAIAEAAGIVSGSLYHYYPHKNLILQELIRENFNDLLNAYEAVVDERLDPASELRGLIRSSLEVSFRHPHASEVFQAEREGLLEQEGFEFLASASDRVKGVWIQTIERGVAAGVFLSDIPAPVVYRLIRDAVWLAIRWMATQDRTDFDRQVEQCVRLFLDGVAEPSVKAA